MIPVQSEFIFEFLSVISKLILIGTGSNIALVRHFEPEGVVIIGLDQRSSVHIPDGVAEADFFRQVHPVVAYIGDAFVGIFSHITVGIILIRCLYFIIRATKLKVFNSSYPSQQKPELLPSSRDITNVHVRNEINLIIIV